MLHAIIRLLTRTILVFVFVGATAQARRPKMEMHRAGADDGSGRHPAVSTKGSFLIRMPIPFNDFTVHDPGTGDVSHAIGGTSAERIKFVAVELPITARTPADIGAIERSLASNKANTSR